MKIEFDTSNPQEVAMVAALIGVGHVAVTQQPQTIVAQPVAVAPVAAVPTPAPVVASVAPAPVQPVTTPAPVQPVAPVSVGSAPDHSTLAAAMQAYAKAHGAAAAKALLAKYGAKKVTDVQAAHLPQILQEAAV